VSGVCLLIAILVLTKSPLKEARNWIFIGIATTILALVLQKVVGSTIFHFVQLAANCCFWIGAKQT
jgi:cell division protein FtsW (lipid II flippase)